MANYNNLKATINANIKANGNEEITGPILNTVLNQAVTTLGDGWSYKGIATPSMSPGTPDSNVFYIATTAGTYTNFGSLVVAEGEVAILKYNGSWAKEVTGAATAAQVTQLGQEVNTNKTNITNLQQEIDDIQPIIIEGNVTNAPDEEDITTDSNDLLKFADRPTAVNQMGYVILRKNKTFAEQVTEANTIYEIRYDFVLNTTVTLPDNCILRFNGGSLSSGQIIVTPQITLYSAGVIVDKDLIVDSANNIVWLELLHDCRLVLSGDSIHGRVFVKSNHSAEITYYGVTGLIPTFENCIIRKTANSGFRNTTNNNEVARFVNCRVYSVPFDERTEGKCTTSFSCAGDTYQDAYNKVAEGLYRVCLDSCEFEGQGVWGNIRAVNCKFIVTENNLYNYELLHLVGDSVIDGCYFTTNVQAFVSGMQDIIDCYTSKRVTITNCIFKSLRCNQIITYKQNPLNEYVIKGGGITLDSNVFEDCIGLAFLYYSDDGKYTTGAFTLFNDTQARITNNFFKNCKSAYSQSSIDQNVGDVITLSFCANVLIQGNRFEYTKRSVFIKLNGYCQNITISDNLFYRAEDSTAGMTFIFSLASQTSGVYLSAKGVRIIGNYCDGNIVLTSNDSSLVNCTGLQVNGNTFLRGGIFNEQITDALSKRFDVEFNNNLFIFNDALTSDVARNPSDSYFFYKRMKYRGSTYFDIGANKLLSWDGFAWKDGNGQTVTP